MVAGSSSASVRPGIGSDADLASANYGTVSPWPLLPSRGRSAGPPPLGFLTRKQRRSDPLCQLFEPLGIKHTMELWLVDRGRIVGGFGFDSSGRDFASRDKLVLETLVPHFAHLHRAARARAARDGETDAPRQRLCEARCQQPRGRRLPPRRTRRALTSRLLCADRSRAAEPRSPSPRRRNGLG